MLQNLTLGQFYPGESSIHGLDPRTKLCGALALMAALIWVKTLPLFFFMLASVAVLVRISNVPPHLLLANLKAFRIILVITFVAHACFTPGVAVVIAGYTIPGPTWEGMLQGAVFSMRLVVIMLIAALLMLTTAPLDVSDGIERLLKPFERFGLPAHELAMMMVIALRFIPTLVEEADRLQKAQAARGANFTGNPVRRVRKMTSLLLPLMLSAFRRAEDLAVAMESRCYRGSTGRTQFRVMALARNDYVAIVAVATLLVLCAAAGSLNRIGGAGSSF